MTSLTEEERLERLRKLLEMWESLREGVPRSGEISDDQREHALIDSLIPLAAKEIIAAVLEDRVARVFCGLQYRVHFVPGSPTTDIDVVGNYTSIYEGIRRAGHTFAGDRSKPIDEHFKSCIAAALARCRDQRIEETQKKSPHELLAAVLDWPRPDAAVLLEHLTFEQLNGLLRLLFERTEPKTLMIKEEPDDDLLWRIWCAGVLLANHPAVGSGERMTIIPIGEEWGKPPPLGVNPAGPMHARFHEQLVKEFKERGAVIRDPASKSRIHRLTGLDRRTITRYLDSDVQVEVIPDENGRVTARFRTKDILRSIKTVRGKKRGPKTDG